MITYLFSRRFEQYFFSQPVLHFFLPLAATSAITYLSFNLGPIFFLKTYVQLYISNPRTGPAELKGTVGICPQIREQISGPDLHVFTLKFLALKKLVFPPIKTTLIFFWLLFTFILCNFSVQTLKYFQKNVKSFFCP